MERKSLLVTYIKMDSLNFLPIDLAIHYNLKFAKEKVISSCFKWKASSFSFIILQIKFRHKVCIMQKYGIISVYPIMIPEISSVTDLGKKNWNLYLCTINKLQVPLINILFFCVSFDMQVFYPIFLSKTCSVFHFHVSSLNMTTQSTKLFTDTY